MSTLVLRKEMEKESQGAFVEPLLAKQVRSQRSRQLLKLAVDLSPLTYYFVALHVYMLSFTALVFSFSF